MAELDLFVIRHATACERDPARWEDDCARPLTPEGETEFRKAARGLKAVAPEMPLVLASPCARAFLTAQILMEEAAWPKPQPIEALRPGIDVEALLATFKQIPPVERLALVGHDPQLSALCGTLCGGQAIELKKGGVARLAVHELAPGGATLRWILPPKVLRRLKG